jgi:hypothetical protein
MELEKLCEQNFLLYAASNYKNSACTDIEEFYEDLNYFKYLKRLLNKYKTKNDLNVRLILNHVIIINNLFGPMAACRMLFLKLEGMEESIIPFMKYIGILSDIIYNIDGKNIVTSMFKEDKFVESRLREL